MEMFTQNTKIILVDDGKVTIYINGIKKSIQFSNDYWKKQRYYSKTGAYIQDSEGDDYTQVQCYELKVYFMFKLFTDHIYL